MTNIIKPGAQALLIAALATALATYAVPAYMPQAIVVGVDMTVEQFDAVSLGSHIGDWVEQHSPDGALIYVVAITGQTLTQPIVLAEIHLPEHPGIKKKERRKQLSQFRQDLAAGLDKRNNFPKAWFKHSQILDFFKLAGQYFEQHHIPQTGRKLLLISDMLQVDERRNWEKQDVLETKEIHMEHIGGTVAIHHVKSSKYPNSDKWEQVRAAWFELLSRARIKVSTYSSTLP